MFAEKGESTVIRSKVMTTIHPKAYPTLNIPSTGMVMWIDQMRVKRTVMQTMNPKQREKIAARLRNDLSSGMCVPL